MGRKAADLSHALYDLGAHFVLGHLNATAIETAFLVAKSGWIQGQLWPSIWLSSAFSAMAWQRTQCSGTVHCDNNPSYNMSLKTVPAGPAWGHCAGRLTVCKDTLLWTVSGKRLI